RHRPAARAGPERGLHHDDHQRAEGVRHRALARTRVVAVAGERDRARDVAHVVRRRQRLRYRVGDRGDPVPARDPRSCTQHPPLQEGAVDVAAAAESIVVPKPQDSTAAKTLRWIARAPIHIILVVLGALWLIPTFGLFITSILPASELASKGWWQIFSKPSLAT